MFKMDKLKKYLHKLKSLSIYFINLPLYWFSFFVPKNKNLWVFGAWAGKNYSDNSRYLFEYVNSNYPNIKAIWLGSDKKTLSLIKNLGYETYHKYSLKGYFISMNAKVFVISNTIKDVNQFTCNRALLVQLWHGTPLKQVIYQDTKEHIKKELLLKRKLSVFFPFLRKEVDFTRTFVSAASDDVKVMFSKVFNTDNIWVTGFPRNDSFYKDVSKMNLDIQKKLAKYKDDGFNLVCYLPTYRLTGFDIMSYLNKNIDFINEEFKKLKAMFILKPHYLQLKKFLAENEQNKNSFSNILFLNDQEIQQDLYSILPFIDTLITDYSSVFFDFLLLNRPIVFTPFDKEDFITINGELLYNYDEVTPGPKAYDWEETIKYIEEAIKYPEKYQKEREIINNRFNKYHDGNSCKRTTEEIIKYLNN